MNHEHFYSITDGSGIRECLWCMKQVPDRTMTTAALIAEFERIHAELQLNYSDAYGMLTEKQKQDARAALYHINSLTASLRKGKDDGR